LFFKETISRILILRHCSFQILIAKHFKIFRNFFVYFDFIFKDFLWFQSNFLFKLKLVRCQCSPNVDFGIIFVINITDWDVIHWNTHTNFVVSIAPQKKGIFRNCMQKSNIWCILMWQGQRKTKKINFRSGAIGKS